MTSEVHIQAALRGGISYLSKAYCTRPFKIADITEDKKDQQLRLMLMNSSPGILDGDDYLMKISVQKNCSLHLSTQSYQRLFTMNGSAAQMMEVHQAPGSSFCFLPHPVVPHKSSSFISKNKIFLSDGCNLVWGEVLTCGRKLNGEVFKFSKYHTLTEIYLNDKLVIKENLMIDPFLINVNAIGQLEGYTHQATLICVNETISIAELVKNIVAYLEDQEEITYGITSAPVNGLIVRLLGQRAEQLYSCLQLISVIIIASCKKMEHAI